MKKSFGINQAKVISLQAHLSISCKEWTLSHCLGMNYYVNFLGGVGCNGFHIKRIFGTKNNWKN